MGRDSAAPTAGKIGYQIVALAIVRGSLSPQRELLVERPLLDEIDLLVAMPPALVPQPVMAVCLRIGGAAVIRCT